MSASTEVTFLELDISKNILEQFAQQLDVEIHNNTFTLNSKLGKGKMSLTTFPVGLEFYHFTFQLNTPVKMQSVNPANSEWLLLNLNLSKTKTTKKVNAEEVNFHKYLPSGILMYTPQTEVQSMSPPFEKFEIVLIRFHHSFLQQYNYNKIQLFQNTDKAIIYEDLDVQLERHLFQILENQKEKLIAHSELLKFLSVFFQKLAQRDAENKYQNLHADDLKGLFLAAAQLRNPLVQKLPSIEALAKVSGMSITKFKTCFKQVFGSPPIKYHLKIKMEYARTQLETHEKSVSEISYELNYSHPSKFTLAYKKHFDMLPSKV